MIILAIASGFLLVIGVISLILASIPDNYKPKVEPADPGVPPNCVFLTHRWTQGGYETTQRFCNSYPSQDPYGWPDGPLDRDKDPVPFNPFKA